jgi:hypothetical protein
MDRPTVEDDLAKHIMNCDVKTIKPPYPEHRVRVAEPDILPDCCQFSYSSIIRFDRVSLEVL